MSNRSEAIIYLLEIESCCEGEKTPPPDDTLSAIPSFDGDTPEGNSQGDVSLDEAESVSKSTNEDSSDCDDFPSDLVQAIIAMKLSDG